MKNLNFHQYIHELEHNPLTLILVQQTIDMRREKNPAVIPTKQVNLISPNANSFKPGESGIGFS